MRYSCLLSMNGGEHGRVGLEIGAGRSQSWWGLSNPIPAPIDSLAASQLIRRSETDERMCLKDVSKAWIIKKPKS